jgi:hypothetical protein
MVLSWFGTQINQRLRHHQNVMKLLMKIQLDQLNDLSWCKLDVQYQENDDIHHIELHYQYRKYNQYVLIKNEKIIHDCMVQTAVDT